jgi:rare lipoprotein A
MVARGYNGSSAEDGQKPPSRYSGYRVGKPYEINGRWYYPAEQPDYDEVGTASWYGEQFHNHYTADGEVFDMNVPSAAHKTLPLPCMVEVTNLSNGRKIVVRVNDRGPFYGDRLIDMSKEAAIELGFYGHGTTQVRVRYLGAAPDSLGGAKIYQASDLGAPPPARPRVQPVKAQPRPQNDRQIEVAAASGALLGSEIDAGPIQSSPGTVSWNAAPTARPAPVQAAPAQSTPAPLADTGAPSPSAVQSAAAPSSDIDSLLNQLASTPPSAPPSAVQAGAFASRANAERAAAALDGQTRIVPVQQSGRMLYKVMLIQ